jgi:hypothetical protein
MTHTERMISIIKLIFDKTEVSTELLSSVMLAFADGAPITDKMTSAEVGEMISRHWLETTKQQMVATVKAHNRRLAQSDADAQTMIQIGDLL